MRTNFTQESCNSRRAIFRTTFLGLALLAVICSALESAQAQSRPFTATDLGRVTELGGLNNNTDPTAVGQRRTTINGVPVVRGFAFFAGRFERFSPFDPADTQDDDHTNIGLAINNGQEAVGEDGGLATSWTSNASGTGFILQLPNLPNMIFGSRAVAINNNGVSVGTTHTFHPLPGGPLNFEVPTRWGAFPQLGVTQLQTAQNPLGFPEPGAALDLNDSGIVVGYQGGTGGSQKRACIFRDNQDPLLFPTIYSEIRGITNGSVFGNFDLITGIGNFATPAGTQTRGFIMSLCSGVPCSTITMLRLPFTYFGSVYPLSYQYLIQPFIGSEARQVNRQGIAVGKMINRNGTTRAAAWNYVGAFADLTANTEGLPAGTVLTEAVDINDNETILAKGSVNGEIRGFLLRRTTVPLTFTFGQYMY